MFYLETHSVYRKQYNYDAFGNALGNSIVEGMSDKSASKAQAKKTADEAYTNAIQSGASEKEATYAAAKAVAEESGGTISSGGSGGSGNSGGSGSSGSNPKLYGSIDGIDETKGFYLSNGSDNAFFNYGDGVLNHVADFLKGSPAAGLAYKFAFNSVQGNQRIEASYQAGVARGIHNYNVGKANRVTTANIIDMNDPATRLAFAQSQGRKTTAELNEVALDIISAPAWILGGAGVAKAGLKLTQKGYVNVMKASLRSSSGLTRSGAAYSATLGTGQMYLGYDVLDTGIGMMRNTVNSQLSLANGDYQFSGTASHIRNVYDEAVSNGGFTLAVGGGKGFDGGIKVDVAAGGYISANFKDLSFSGGLYGSFEFGGNVALPVGMPSVGSAYEATLFTSPDYKNALSGGYFIGGAQSSTSQRGFDVGMIKAHKGAINGYQISGSRASNYMNETNYTSGLYGKFGYGEYWKWF